MDIHGVCALRLKLIPQCLTREKPLIESTDAFYLQLLDIRCYQEINPRIHNLEHMLRTKNKPFTTLTNDRNPGRLLAISLSLWLYNLHIMLIMSCQLNDCYGHTFSSREKGIKSLTCKHSLHIMFRLSWISTPQSPTYYLVINTKILFSNYFWITTLKLKGNVFLRVWNGSLHL